MDTPTNGLYLFPLYRTENGRLVASGHAKTSGVYWGCLQVDRGTWGLITRDDEVVGSGVWKGKLSGRAFNRFLNSMGTLADMANPKPPPTVGEAIRYGLNFLNKVGDDGYAKGWDDCLAAVHEIVDRTEVKNSE